nr:hypothetical protein DA06_05835 [Georgenia sp. SUBG003]
MVDAGTTVPLTLVCAPAGSGKTVLVSSWARSRPDGPPAWVSLDEYDLRDGSFWPLVVDALTRHGVGPLATPYDGGRAFLVALGGALCALDVPVVLVLDCQTSLPLDVAGGLESLLRSSGGSSGSCSSPVWTLCCRSTGTASTARSSRSAAPTSGSPTRRPTPCSGAVGSSSPALPWRA